MGKIIRNGIHYSGSGEEASSVNFNSTGTRLSSTNVQDAIAELAIDDDIVVLYDSPTSAGVGGGTNITLNEDKADFKFNIYLYRTNAQYMSEIVYGGCNCVGKTTGMGTWDTTNHCWQYNAFLEIMFSDPTHASLTASYNNANLQLHLVSIWGMERISS